MRATSARRDRELAGPNSLFYSPATSGSGSSSSRSRWKSLGIDVRGRLAHAEGELPHLAPDPPRSRPAAPSPPSRTSTRTRRAGARTVSLFAGPPPRDPNLLQQGRGGRGCRQLRPEPPQRRLQGAGESGSSSARMPNWTALAMPWRRLRPRPPSSPPKPNRRQTASPSARCTSRRPRKKKSSAPWRSWPVTTMPSPQQDRGRGDHGRGRPRRGLRHRAPPPLRGMHPSDEMSACSVTGVDPASEFSGRRNTCSQLRSRRIQEPWRGPAMTSANVNVHRRVEWRCSATKFFRFKVSPIQPSLAEKAHSIGTPRISPLSVISSGCLPIEDRLHDVLRQEA